MWIYHASLDGNRSYSVCHENEKNEAKKYRRYVYWNEGRQGIGAWKTLSNVKPLNMVVRVILLFHSPPNLTPLFPQQYLRIIRVPRNKFTRIFFSTSRPNPKFFISMQRRSVNSSSKIEFFYDAATKWRRRKSAPFSRRVTLNL